MTEKLQVLKEKVKRALKNGTLPKEKVICEARTQVMSKTVKRMSLAKIESLKFNNSIIEKSTHANEDPNEVEETFP